jgi:hypothetical protein
VVVEDEPLLTLLRFHPERSSVAIVKFPQCCVM